MERLHLSDGPPVDRQDSRPQQRVETDRRYAQPQPRYEDAQVRPAAGASSSSPRAARNNEPQNRKSSGSFMSRLKLPNLLPSSLRGGNDEPIQDNTAPPMPYDPSELRREPSQRQAARTNAPPLRPATVAAPQRAERSESPLPAPVEQAEPRVARSSPSTGDRRNELAEALSGLSPERPAPPSEQSPAWAESVPMPEATEDEQLPEYLSDSPTARPATPRTSAKAAPVRVAAPPAARDRGQAVGSMPATAAPARSAESTAPAPNTVRNRFAARRDVADVLRGEAPASAPAEPSPSQLGAIAAQPAPTAASSTPPAASAAPVATSRPTVAPETALRPSREVLFSSQQPSIASKIEGPHQIVVGQQAEYRVTLVNTGEAAAHELVAEIAAPAEADLVDAAATNGEVQRPAASGSEGGKIAWRLYELAPGASQTLTLQLVPRSGRQFQLGVQWRHAPVGGQATVEVQEPKLNMEITGPSDVLFGQSQRYALTLTNPGNGTAEGVAIELTPPGGGAESLVRHTVGQLAPGESKKIELELTAREAGELPIKAIATAAGNLRAEAVKDVLCRKSELEVDWRGPDKKYAGSVAAYFFRVRNPGTATAEQVSVEVTLPPGAELVQSSDGHAWDAKRRTVSWKTAAINAGEERFLKLECRMTQPGVNQMEVLAQSAAGDLRDSKTAQIAVEAIADLKLAISDPKGVVPVGEMAEYEIRIQNRGMSAARGVNVVAMFSEGLDPSHVEGGQHSISDGRVAFRTIDTLAAGGETVLRIHAKATQSGTHIFRTEVACEELEVKLAAEETTRFFTEEDRWADASSAYSDEDQTTTR